MDTGGGDQELGADEIVEDMLNQAIATVIAIVAKDFVNDDCNVVSTDQQNVSVSVFNRDMNEDHSSVEEHTSSSIGSGEGIKNTSRECPTTVQLLQRGAGKGNSVCNFKRHSGYLCQYSNLRSAAPPYGQCSSLDYSPGMAISSGRQWSRTLHGTSLINQSWWSMGNVERACRLKQALDQYEQYKQYKLQSYKTRSQSVSLMKAYRTPNFPQDQLMSIKLQCDRQTPYLGRELLPEAPLRPHHYTEDSSEDVRKHPAREPITREERIERLKQKVMAEYELDRATRGAKMPHSLPLKSGVDGIRTNREFNILTIYTDDTEYTYGCQCTICKTDVREDNTEARPIHNKNRMFPPKCVATETNCQNTFNSTCQPGLVETRMSNEHEKNHADLVALNGKIIALQDHLKTFEAYLLQACELNNATEAVDSGRYSAQSDGTTDKLNRTCECIDDNVDEEDMWEDTDSSVTSGEYITVFEVDSSKFDYDYMLDCEPDVKDEKQSKGLGNRILRGFGRMCGRKSKD